MTDYRAPVKDTLFILNDVLALSGHNNLPGFQEATPDTIEAVLNEAAKLAQDVLHPLNQKGDRQGCKRHEDGTVNVPEGFKDAFQAYREGGWISLPFPDEYGGQNLPSTLACCVNEYVTSANMAFSLYPGLTAGAVCALLEHASDSQKQTYLPKLVAGEWTGTMNLTEPHCGTDLGLIRTKAVREKDGTFRISGQKIFISAGEHDLSSNIVHLVLARIEGAPEGVKGISLFIVPKFILDEAGEPGERNGVMCGSIEEKMGLHGNSTCVMNYDNATGFLVGEENKGLKAMFVMMNDARLGVGLQGLAQSEVAFQNAALYAKERRQGRAVSGAKETEHAADRLIVHADIRRQLTKMKAVNEAARALILWASLQSDIYRRSEDETERQEADDMLGLLTPVIKGVLTDRGFEQTVMAQQIYGGHGYIAEGGMEQFVRDSRIAMIYEGTNSVQALDLVGRKLPKDGGRAIRAWFGQVDAFCAEQGKDEKMKPFAEPLAKGSADLQKATLWLANNAMKEPDNAAATAYDYMHLFGIVAMGYMSARMARAALDKMEQDGAEKEFCQNKLKSARYFMDAIMPETALRLAVLEKGCESVMAMNEDAF